MERLRSAHDGPRPVDLDVPISIPDGGDLSGVPVARVEQVRRRGELAYLPADQIDWDWDIVTRWDLRGSIWEERLAAYWFVELRPGLHPTRFALVTEPNLQAH